MSTIPRPPAGPPSRREQIGRALYAEAHLLRDLADALELRAEGSTSAFGVEQVHMLIDAAFRARMAVELLGTVEEASAGVLVLLDEFRHAPRVPR